MKRSHDHHLALSSHRSTRPPYLLPFLAITHSRSLWRLRAVAAMQYKPSQKQQNTRTPNEGECPAIFRYEQITGITCKKINAISPGSSITGKSVDADELCESRCDARRCSTTHAW